MTIREVSNKELSDLVQVFGINTQKGTPDIYYFQESKVTLADITLPQLYISIMGRVIAELKKQGVVAPVWYGARAEGLRRLGRASFLSEERRKDMRTELRRQYFELDGLMSSGEFEVNVAPEQNLRLDNEDGSWFLLHTDRINFGRYKKHATDWEMAYIILQYHLAMQNPAQADRLAKAIFEKDPIDYKECRGIEPINCDIAVFESGVYQVGDFGDIRLRKLEDPLEERAVLEGRRKTLKDDEHFERMLVYHRLAYVNLVAGRQNKAVDMLHALNDSFKSFSEPMPNPWLQMWGGNESAYLFSWNPSDYVLPDSTVASYFTLFERAITNSSVHQFRRALIPPRDLLYEKPTPEEEEELLLEMIALRSKTSRSSEPLETRLRLAGTELAYDAARRVKLVRTGPLREDVAVRVIKTELPPLLEEMQRMQELELESIERRGFSVPHVLGVGTLDSGKSGLFMTKAEGITLDEALSDARYQVQAYVMLPEVVDAIVYTHLRFENVDESEAAQAQGIVEKTLRKKFASDSSKVYDVLTDEITELVLNLVSPLLVIEEMPYVVNYDSHPENFIVKPEGEGKLAELTKLTRIDHAKPRDAYTPFVAEVANLYRFVRGTPDFSPDFRGLTHYVDTFNEKSSGRQIEVDEGRMKLAYLNAVIFRTLCFYEGRGTRNAFIRDSIAKTYNIEHAVGAIERNFSEYFRAHDSCYAGARLLANKLRLAAFSRLKK